MEKALREAGWQLVRDDGSRRHYRKIGNPNVVTISGHPGVGIKPGLLAQIRRKSGVDVR